MPNIKAFVNKIKDKSAKYKAEQNEKTAKAKGFSSHKAFTTFKEAAEYDGKEKANKQKRKTELNKIEKESYEETMQSRSGKYHKYQKKIIKGMESVQKGAGVYNEMIGGLQSIGGGYGDDYPKSQKRSKKKGQKRKPQKTKSKSRNNKGDFWSQFQ